MGLESKRTVTQQTAVAGTGAVTVIPASGDSTVYRDLVSLVVTTPNTGAATLTISDGTKTVAVINYPNATGAPSTPLVLQFADVPLAQSKSNAAWTITASVNVSGFNVTAQFIEQA